MLNGTTAHVCQGFRTSYVRRLQRKAVKANDAFQSVRKARHPDISLRHLSELTPEFVKKMGWKGLIFDMDDTLKPMSKSRIQPEMIASLRKLRAAGIQIGIVSNNPFRRLSRRLLKELSQSDLNLNPEERAKMGLSGIPLIFDGCKPFKIGFRKMLTHMNLKPSEVAVLGDGSINDIIGGKMLGMGTIKVGWYRQNIFRRFFAAFIDLISLIFNPAYRRFGVYKEKASLITMSLAQLPTLDLLTPSAKRLAELLASDHKNELVSKPKPG